MKSTKLLNRESCYKIRNTQSLEIQCLWRFADRYYDPDVAKWLDL